MQSKEKKGPRNLQSAPGRQANEKCINRWKDYLPVGQRMPGTRFIAFKVPLKKVSKN